MIRIVFMGTPEFAVPSLKALVNSQHRVVGVVTQPDRPKGRGQKVVPSPVKRLAREKNLPVYQPESLLEDWFLKILHGLAPDAIVVVAFGQKIPGEVLNLPRYGCINVHGSLLPKYRGAAPIHRAIMNGEKITGVTTMYVTEGWDEGDVILQREVGIGLDDTVGELHDTLAGEGAILLIDTMRRIAERTAPRIPQDPAGVTYAPKLRPEESEIDWNMDAAKIHNLVRGMNPWPGAYTFHGKSLLKVWRTGLHPGGGEAAAPGEVVAIRKGEGFVVTAGEGGAVIVREVQPENGRRMSAEEYGMGHRIEMGTVFGRPAGLEG